MSFLESPPQITPLSTKFMHERGGIPQLDKYQNAYLTKSWRLTIFLYVQQHPQYIQRLFLPRWQCWWIKILWSGERKERGGWKLWETELRVPLLPLALRTSLWQCGSASCHIWTGNLQFQYLPICSNTYLGSTHPQGPCEWVGMFLIRGVLRIQFEWEPQDRAWTIHRNPVNWLMLNMGLWIWWVESEQKLHLKVGCSFQPCSRFGHLPCCSESLLFKFWPF